MSVKTKNTASMQELETQVHSLNESAKEPRQLSDASISRRPEMLSGYTRQIRAPEGKVNITVNSDETGPLEVFITLGKAGSDISAMAEALGRLISLSLQLPSPMSTQQRVSEIADQLSGIGGSRAVGFGPNRVSSLPDAVARALSLDSAGAESGEGKVVPISYGSVEAQEDEAVELSGALCPSCGCAAMVRAEGCSHCILCGHSEC